MSRRLRLGPAVAALLTLFLGSPAASLRAQQTVDELERRVRELQPIVTEAHRAAQQARERRALEEELRNETRTDTIQVGPLAVVTLPDQVELARELFGHVLNEEFAFVTSDGALDGALFTFEWRTPIEPIFLRDDNSNRRVEVQRYRSRDVVVERIRTALGTALAVELDFRSQVRRWIAGPVRTPPDLSWTYRQIALTPSKTTRACLAGDAMGCWAALGLGIADADRLATWYTEEERMRMVLGSRGIRSLRARRELGLPEVVACVDRREVEACDRVILEHLSFLDTTPLSQEVRATMLWFALQEGGEGAWDRLLESADWSPDEALVHTSGLAAEALAAGWRAWVLEARPRVHAGIGATRWAAFFWILILIALAMRSTRWRLG